jgi:hypothetical protein
MCGNKLEISLFIYPERKCNLPTAKDCVSTTLTEVQNMFLHKINILAKIV